MKPLATLALFAALLATPARAGEFRSPCRGPRGACSEAATRRTTQRFHCDLSNYRMRSTGSERWELTFHSDRCRQARGDCPAGFRSAIRDPNDGSRLCVPRD